MGKPFDATNENNVVNSEKLIVIVTSYGATYNPSKTALKIPALTTLSANGKTATSAIHALVPANKKAIAEREIAFAPLSKLITRVHNAVIASDTTEQIDDNVNTIVRKLQGRRATPKKTDEEKKLAADAGNPINEISSSQLTYDSQVENLDKLIKQLTTIPQYTPNEADLKITALTTLYTDLKAKNIAVLNSLIPLNKARNTRDEILNTDNTGLVDVFNDAKTYIKSIFGATSPQFKEVSKLKFIKHKK